MSAQNTGGSSLRPGWYKGSGGGGGRGFQPPPTVTSDRGDKGRSGSWGSQERRDSNKFSALQDDEDLPSGQGPNGKSEEKPSSNSRSEAFRTSFSRASSTGSKAGRSLADLAARVPEPPAGGRRPSGFDSRGASGSGRFSSLRASEQGTPAGSIDSFRPDPKVIRYTREKLLSMRPAPRGPENGPPEHLQWLDGSVILSKICQDPVCWDTFNSEGIWEAARERRVSTTAPKAAPAGTRGVPEPSEDQRRRNPAAPSSGRWQRGVALPPPEEGGRKKEKDAENPNELWDDPIGGATGAAADFSAFGAMPTDDDLGGAFDFDKMAEASRKLDEELHGPKGSENGDDIQQSMKVDASRPLASAGMTIKSGSGDDVNVFEDFDDPSEPEANAPTIRGGDENPSASSRLMQMIGVTREPVEHDSGKVEETSSNPWGNTATEGSMGASSLGGVSSAVPLNPWGGPVASSTSQPEGGMDLGALLSVQQKNREVGASAAIEKRAQQEAEMVRRRQEEDAQRRALAQRQAEQQARQQQAQAAALQQQQQTPQQSQVELVLMERICAILENSWGRSDLVSILNTLHSEDSRVIPLLGNADALRALLARSPQRVALRRDPNFAGDIAVLLVTNSQWQQQQQQIQARLQQEELKRRRMQEEEAAARAVASINPDLPWFYSDPQNNIQGPFTGDEMRQWLEAGYFKGDLPISQQPSGPFHPLANLFKDLSVAFRAPESNTAEEADKAAADEEQRRKRAEEEERRAAELAAKAGAEAREAAERERIEKAAEVEAAAAQAISSSNRGNESSAQLKMMLGLPSDLQSSADSVQEPPAPAVPPKPTEKRSKGGSKKSQQKPVKEDPVPAQTEKAPKTAKSASSAWGAAANAKPKKSMSEIQQEEARAAAIMAMQRGGAPQSSSGWANVAAGTSGWSSGTLKQTAASNSNAMANARSTQQRAKPQNATQATKTVAPLTQKQRSSSTASSSTPAEEFGATMSPVLEKWCKEQMQKITGSDDLTLVGFCMTLPDANEIRQYLTTYLGSTPQVNNFATEFINKRGLGNKQEEWETPGSAKKGRKKKQGGR